MPKQPTLRIYEPEFGSELTSTIIDLEKLRVNRLGGPVPPYIFFQLKNIFHLFESLGSARIEGNNTTLAEFVEKIIEKKASKNDEKTLEITNINKAIEYIEETVNKDTIFSRSLISDIHKIIVEGLTPHPEGEGSRYPGELRPVNVTIQGSSLKTPDYVQVPHYFDELLNFINQPVNSQFHLLIVAMAHHYMAWIHPFDNGNGRLIRMLTYALLIKQGFQVKTGRILNPTAIFCMDRNKYYDMLRLADTGEKDNVLKWCFYVLDGLRKEIEKIDKLLNFEYMTNSILLPVLAYALDRQHITKQEYEILKTVVKNEDMVLKSGGLVSLGTESPVQRSRIIKKLKEKDMLIPLKENGRIYTIGFVNNFLFRDIAYILEQNGFIPEFLNKK